MERLSSEAVRKSMKLFMKLLERSRVKKSEDTELFESYEDAEVAEVMGMFEEEAGVMFIRTGDTLYYTPKTDNRFFGFTNEELRDSMKLSNNTELYAAYIIILGILIKFYNGENYNIKCRTLLKVEELERYITTKLQIFSEKDSGEAEEQALGFNFSSVTKLWLEIPSYDEKISHYSRSSGTRISLIYKTLFFMRDQGLVNIANENEIFTTDKLDVMATAYYPESGRKKEILSYLDGLTKGVQNNADN